MKTEQGFFVNRYAKPAYSDIIRIIGNERGSWEKLYFLLREELKLKARLNFHDGSGWVFEFYRSGKLKVILMPDKNYFIVSLPRAGKQCLEINGFNDIKDLYSLIHDHVKKLPLKWHNMLSDPITSNINPVPVVSIHGDSHQIEIF